MAEEKQPSHEEMLAMQKQNCIFCKIIKKEIPSKIVHTDKICSAILDINPANEGHILLIPNEHYSIMPQVPGETIGHMAVISKKLSKSLLLSTMGKSTSIFIANGAAAGQKAPHFMMHIIPRKNPQEFFKIQNNASNPKELDELEKIITQKLNHLLGKKPAEKIEVPKPSEIKEEIHQKKIEQEQKPIIIQPSQELSGNKIMKAGIKREKGYLYFIDEDGDIARTKMARGRTKKGEKQKKEKVTSSKENEKSVTLDDISNLLLGGRK